MKKTKYQPLAKVNLADRHWLEATIEQSPTWCSIDLREGNQSLPNLMSIEKKLIFFEYLVSLGFKQIEVGIPGRFEEDIRFLDVLVNEQLIPNDVTIQVLTTLKQSDIDLTLDSVKDCSSVIINLFQFTYQSSRNAIFDMEGEQLLQHIVSHVQYAKQQAEKILQPGQYQFAFSAEGFNATEPELLLKIYQSVIELIVPTADLPLIVNLVAGVESEMPHHFADKVEWLVTQLEHPSSVIFSVQTHNDQGHAVANSEMALYAGVSRVEGALLGMGERAGACCLVTLALNLYSRGIALDLDFSNLAQMDAIIEYCSGMTCSPRHPYVGDLVFSTFYSPHQFAIHQAYQSFMQGGEQNWQIPYLPIDPNDIGRGNDDLIRLNALSGRTGIAYVMEKRHGYLLPRGLQDEFCKLVKEQALSLGAELTAEQVWECFANHFFKQEKQIKLTSIQFDKDEQSNRLICHCDVSYQGKQHQLQSKGNGPLDTIIKALTDNLGLTFDVMDYHQHSLGHGSRATAVSYISISDEQGKSFWGVGVDPDTNLATLDALFGALNRQMEKK